MEMTKTNLGYFELEGKIFLNEENFENEIMYGNELQVGFYKLSLKTKNFKVKIKELRICSGLNEIGLQIKSKDSFEINYPKNYKVKERRASQEEEETKQD